MDLFSVLTMAGGLAMFLFGMNIMSASLEKQAGGRLKRILAGMTSNPLKGFLLGLAVTAVIQSSSATTVMVVGLVSASVMTLRQAITVIMGANVGTTVTAWILSLSGIDSDVVWMKLLKPSSFAPILAVIGVFLLMAGKTTRRKDIGTILLGFTVLMFGMDTMTDAVSGLAEIPQFRNILLTFSNPFFGVLAGAILTAIIQSSSASVGILQALSSTGAVTVSAAIPIIMGQNIGTCVTALLSCAGASKDAKRAAMVHLYFNIIGTVTVLCGFYALNAVFDFSILSSIVDEKGIAVIHSLFNIVCTAMLLPCAGLLEKLARATVRNAPEPEEFRLLDERLLASPSVAVERCNDTVKAMAELSADLIHKSLSMLSSYDAKTAAQIREGEDKVDRYEDRVGSYLVKLSSQSMTDADSHETNKLLRFIGDFERISDHAVNLLESAEEINDKKMTFSPEAVAELDTLGNAVCEVLELTVSAFAEDSLETALKVEPLEQVVDLLKEKIKLSHTLRIRKSECTIEHGFVLSDILTNLERVSDHCSNVAAFMLEMSLHENTAIHKYVSDMHAGGEGYDKRYREYRHKYSV